MVEPITLLNQTNNAENIVPLNNFISHQEIIFSAMPYVAAWLCKGDPELSEVSGHGGHVQLRFCCFEVLNFVYCTA
jgi:hypothetical protein